MDYAQLNNNLFPTNWLKRMSAFGDVPVLNVPQYAKPLNSNITKKPNWLNKERPYKVTFTKNEFYNNNSGNSPCPSTPKKYYNNLPEAFDVMSLSGGPDIK